MSVLSIMDRFPNLGKASKILFVLYLISTIKTLPFVYLIRFSYQTAKNLILPRLMYHFNGGRNTFGYSVRGKEGEVVDKYAVFRPQVFPSYVSPMEIDMYFHKSNSTYYADLDIARTDLVTKVFQVLFYRYFDNKNGHFKRRSLHNLPYIPAAAVEAHFKRELKVFQRFNIHSKVIAWDRKWLFVLSKFVDPRDPKKVYAVALTKYVFKRGRLTIPPEEFIKELGLWCDEVGQVNAKNFAIVEHMVDLEELDKQVEQF